MSQAGYALSGGVNTSEGRLRHLLLLSAGPVPCLSLFLVGQGGQPAGDLPNLDISQRIGKFLSMGLDKGGI